MKKRFLLLVSLSSAVLLGMAFMFVPQSWIQVGVTAVASSVPFSDITSATNTVAAMVVGSGASMDFTGTGTIDANEIVGVPFCSGFSPTNAQFLQYTTGGTPNPCYSSASGGGGSGGPQYVQANTIRGTSVATPFNVVSGDILLVELDWFGGSNAPSTVSDTLGSTYTKILEQTGNGGDNISAFIATMGSSGANTITGSYPSGAAFQGVGVTEILGASSVDAFNSGSCTGAVAVTTSQNNDYIWIASASEHNSEVAQGPAIFLSEASNDDSNTLLGVSQPAASLFSAQVSGLITTCWVAVVAVH